ncbi:hypothetical protein [Thalassotalea piscium]|uniref:Uncharacterized protein n=1 Tax=Thalassotalea piscium TaxID=1230533 RepID=A0A7X0NH77_9GAMM|nr:hypothetical protein [Thalassotalea piscium]MBB6543305.1 hypothetical protein [Thalassotalea piscium]
MNTNLPSNPNDDIEFELAKMSEHANSKRFRDRNNLSFAKKHTDRKDRKKSRDIFNDDHDEYYDEWN